MPLPGNLSLTLITGPIVDDQGNALSGLLELRSSINRVLNVGGLVVPVYRRIQVLDGSLTYGLLPSSAFSRAGKTPWTWHATFTTADQLTKIEFDILVPDSGPVTIGSIASVPDTGDTIVIGTGTDTGTGTGTGTGGSNQGVFGTPTVNSSGALVVPFSSNWGLRDNGSAYYSSTGATAGQAAYLTVSSTGALVLVKPKSTVA